MRGGHLVVISKTSLVYKGGKFKLPMTYLNLTEPPLGDLVKYFAFSKTKAPRKNGLQIWTRDKSLDLSPLGFIP